MAATLWQIEVSLYSEKVRWALAHKDVAHVRRAPPPGSHRLVALALTRGRHDRFPVLRLDGGQVVGDSTAIIAALEREHPDPPLYPSDPADRERALALETFFDEECGPHMRRFAWQQMIDDTDAVRDTLLPRAPAMQQRALRLVFPAFRPLLRRDFGISAQGAEDSLASLRLAVDRLEDELGDGDYLVGDAFTVADLTAASMLTPLLCPPEREYPPASIPDTVRAVREELEARRGGQWVHEMYGRHRGQGVVAA